MLISILGILIVTVFTFNPFFKAENSSDSPNISIPLPWGIAFDIVFIIMFISSIISINPPWIEGDAPQKKVKKAKKARR